MKSGPYDAEHRQPELSRVRMVRSGRNNGYRFSNRDEANKCMNIRGFFRPLSTDQWQESWLSGEQGSGYRAGRSIREDLDRILGRHLVDT